MFEKIGLAKEGRDSFYELLAMCDREDFKASLDGAITEYDKEKETNSDTLTEFGKYVDAFALREGIPGEKLSLFIYILLGARGLENYRKKGMPEDIFYETFADMVSHCEKFCAATGVYGLPCDKRRWFRHHVNGTIFRIGRLVFHYTDSIYDAEIEGRKVKKGDKIISVHIPAAGRLVEEDCEAAYDAARAFFKKYFGVDECIFFCYSWIMQPWLAEVLPESSLIVRFQNKYDIIDFQDSPEDMLHWVFGKEEIEDPTSCPEDTTLQRVTKARLLKGEIIGYGSGIRL